MKGKVLIPFGLFSTLLLLANCSNRIESVKIGSQRWSEYNLDVDHFRNGDKIPEAKTFSEWDSAEPVWCYYMNDSANGEKWGKLYNWHAVNDPRGLAPKGWHIPSYDEWLKLVGFLGGEDVAGTKMKSLNGWHKGGGGFNESGFNGLPGGLRYNSGSFSDSSGDGGLWWSSTESSSENAWACILHYEHESLDEAQLLKTYGMSVRIVKD